MSNRSEYFLLTTTPCVNESTLNMVNNVGSIYPKVNKILIQNYLTNLIILNKLPDTIHVKENISIETIDTRIG